MLDPEAWREFAPADVSAGQVAGVDEAGRGPLAGPVVAAAVILDPARPIDGLADSKKLSEKRREALAVDSTVGVQENAVCKGKAPKMVAAAAGHWLGRLRESRRSLLV